MDEQDVSDETIYYAEYDSAIMGITTKGQIVYDVDECIDVLVSTQNMGYEDATEYFWFNTESAYVGEMTPIFIWRRCE